MNEVPGIRLNSGHTIPQLGMGVYRLPNDETERLLSHAFEIGYRHIDTAALYGNEEGVGRAIAASGIPREELFITTKVWNSDQGAERTRAAMARSLDRLGLDYVDLYLIHWPQPGRNLYLETWLTLEELHAEGLARSIGVSNFLVEHLERVLAEGSVPPAVDQLELHPAFQQRAVCAFARSRGIAIESWGPLGQGKYNLFDEAPVARAAKAHGKSPAQVVIRWHLQSGNIVFPKSGDSNRLAENFDVFDFELTEEEVDGISALDRGQRGGFDPNEFNH